MELSQLRYFVAVAEAENISRAASTLRVAQPAVSRQIRNLELELGQDLFTRSERGVALTPTGRDYLASIKVALKQIDKANDCARAGGGAQRILHIGIVQLAQWYPRVTRLIRTFRERNPGTKIEGMQMPSSEQPSALLRGEIDIAIGVPLADLPADFLRIHLFAVPRGIVVAAHHPLAGESTVSISDIRQFPLITTSRRTWIGDVNRFFEASRAEGFTPDFAETFENFSMVLSRLHDGHSVAVLPEPGPDAPMEGLEFRRVAALELDIPLDIYWPRKSNTPELRAFVDLVKAEAGTE